MSITKSNPINPIDAQTLLTGSDVARILKVSRSFAYILMRRGEIPTVRMGSAVRVRPENLEEYIAKNVTRR